MKDSIQIKAELFEGRHDALLGFYERYNRLFASKLLLKLCEGILPKYKPNLALFDQHPKGPKVKGRRVSILIEKASSPLLYGFYCDLPYGSKTMVFINLMNSYAQLAEADPKLMESLYWDGIAPNPQASISVSAHDKSDSAESLRAQITTETDMASNNRPGPVSTAAANETTLQPANEPEPDPLSEFDIGL
jgi:hypothetical protein